MMKRLMGLVLLVTLLCVISVPLLAVAQDYVSITNMHEDVESGWHEAYEAQGRTITVDIEIQLPMVEKCPIIQVDFCGRLAGLHPNEEIVDASFPNGISVYTLNLPEKYWGKGGIKIMTDGVAENSQLGPEDVSDIFLRLLNQYEDQTGKVDLELAGLVAYGRTYAYIYENGQIVGSDFTKPVTETGKYELRYYQQFHCIPWLVNDYFSYQTFRGPSLPVNIIRGSVYAEDAYAYAYVPVKEKAIYTEDVPLAPFSWVKAEYEKWIRAGLIRDVYEIRFGYMPFYDPKDPQHSILLLPVWVLHGDIYENSKQESRNMREEDLLAQHSMGEAGQVVVLAQTATLLDKFNDKRANRQSADQIILWEQVR